MIQINEALTQIDEKREQLDTLRTLLTETDDASFIHFFYECAQANIKLSHYLSDNRALLRSIKDHVNDTIKETGFFFSMKELHLNADKLYIEHQELGMIGEVYLSKKRFSIWKNPFRSVITKQKDIEYQKGRITEEQERLKRYEEEVHRYKKFPFVFKKMKRITAEHFVKFEEILTEKNETIEKLKTDLVELIANNEGEYDRFINRSFEFKRFIRKMEQMDFTHNFYAFEDKMTYFMRYREDKNASLSSILTYEEGHISLLHDKEWDASFPDPNLSNFRFTEEEFVYLLEQIKPHFPEVKRERIESCDTLTVETENGNYYLCKEGFVVIHGEDLNLYHLLRFPSIRQALCLTYKTRTHEDVLNAIQRK